MPPVFSNIMAPPPPKSALKRRALSELSTHSNGVDFTSVASGQRPIHSNRPNAANVERITHWLSTHAQDGTFLAMDRQEPRSTSEDQDVVMTDGGSFVDRGAVVEPQYLFSRPGAPKRKISCHGHRDQDPGTPEPSRVNIKALLSGKYVMPSSPARKKVRASPRPPQHSALHMLRQQTPVINVDDEVTNSSSAAAPTPPTASASAPPPPPPPPPPPLLSLAPTAPLSSRVTGRGPPPIIAYSRRPTQATTPASTPASSFSESQAQASNSARVPGPEPILVLRRSRMQVSASDASVTPAQDLRVTTEPASSAAPSAFSTPMTPTESLGDDLESPASPELLPTPTRRKPGRKPKQKRLVSRPKPQPKPAEAAVGAGTEATGDVLNDAGGEIKESAFFNIPQEVRNRIYRHLLVSRNPIQVKQLWTEPARQKARRMPRRRGAAPEKLFNEETDMGIDPRILCVSKQAYLEGSRILYSENTFHYMLRDPKSRARAHTTLSPTGPNQINFAKYCHLFRHMSIELEPNRTDHEHERLLERSLECLARADGSSSPSSSRANSPASRIFLDTLTLTITPVKPVKIPVGNMPGGRSRIPTAIKFFSRNSVADRLLRRINTRSIRFNIHVEPHREDEDSDDESDDDDLGLDESAIVRTDGTNNLRHLETTIDLRFNVRYMNHQAARYIENPYYDESFAGDDSVPKVIRVYPDEFWDADHHILAKRAMVGQRAEYALAELHSRLWEAWKNPDQAVREGLWEDHGVAEQRRRINRAKHQVKFDCDALLFQKKRKKKTKTAKKGKEVAGRDDWRYESDDEICSTDTEFDTDEDNNSECDESDADNESTGGHQLVRTPAKSLIISIGRHGGAIRAFRAN